MTEQETLKKLYWEWYDLKMLEEEIFNLKDKPLWTSPFIYRKDTKKAIDIMDRKVKKSEEIKKEVSFWNYLIFTFNNSYFFTKLIK